MDLLENDMKKKIYKNCISGRKYLPNSGDLLHVCCAAYILNLIVQDSVRVAQNAEALLCTRDWLCGVPPLEEDPEEESLVEDFEELCLSSFYILFSIGLVQLDLHHVVGGQIGDYYSFLFNTKIFEESSVYVSAIANKLIDVVDKHYASTLFTSCY
ncbi:hypothetical protein RCOM_0012680 [Ricinus communis]|uniref:Uncharacterized protein n=1 Tax=Ricinus communis TaxID=3988 RepID=B9SYW4_RICCO|nr:hypothetical protein RCOM_0012680 [Ricinus communis]